MVEEEFKVRFHEMTPERVVPIWALQNYFQQAAAMDADGLSYGIEELFSAGVAWALINIKFEIAGEIKGIQNVKIKTWHCHSDKIYSRRDFIIYDETGAEKIKGTSMWVIIDLAKRKIARTPQVMLNQKLPSIDGMESVSGKPPSFEAQTPLSCVLIRTRSEDMDINSHVNNIHFTAWALEGMPEDIKNKMTLKEIFVIFKNEAHAGEEITVKTFDNGDNTFWHILTRNSDGKEISSSYTVWK